MRFKVFIFLLLLLPCLPTRSQDAGHISLLSKQIASATNDAERILRLAELAEYYAAFNRHAQSDSALQIALRTAEAAHDRALIIRTLVDNNIANLSVLSNAAVFDQAIATIERGVSYAQAEQNRGLEALGYIRLAGIYRKRRRYEEALQQTTMASTALSDTRTKDSLHVELFCEIGRIYSAKSRPVDAVRNYNAAYDLAYRLKLPAYQSHVYHLIADLYWALKRTENAREYLLESLNLNRKSQDKSGLYADYYQLARLTDEKSYIDSAILLANELKSPLKNFKARMLMYFWYMVKGADSEKSLAYLNKNQDIVDYFNNTDPMELCWQRGNIYKFGGKYSSALDCFSAAEKSMVATKNPARILEVYKTLGDAYLRTGDISNGNRYYLMTYRVADSLSDFPILKTAASVLDTMYAARGDFANAYRFNKKADSVAALLAERDERDKLVLLEIDREKNKTEIDRAEFTHELERKHGLQITAIVIVITLLFMGMLFMGLFEIPKRAYRMIGYFVFIALFEFIILLMEHPLVELTGGEPIRLWLIKIAIIAILVQIHHFLEHHVVNFLESKKLMQLRDRFSRKKKSVAAVPEIVTESADSKK